MPSMPARSPLNCYVKVALLGLVRHLWQMLDVDMNEAWLVVFEVLVPGLLVIFFVLSSQLRGCWHFTPFERAVQPRTRQSKI